MLILSRFRNQKIKIEDIVTLNIMSVNNKGSVSIGIQAPRAVPVHREEVYSKVKESNSEEFVFSETIKKFSPQDVGSGYLILSRHKGQRIRICDDVVITVLDIRKGAVKLGIDAPENVSIHRQEVFEKIQAEEA